MKILIGLGNPGAEYANTRHNVGMLLVERVASSLANASSYGWRREKNILIFETKDLVLVKSGDIFMNESGRLVQGLPEGELYVAHDDLDIRLGEYKIQFGRGPKEHGGINSIESVMGKEFWRMRIGIDNRGSDLQVSGEEYVLQKFTSEEKVILDEVLDEIVKANFGRED